MKDAEEKLAQARLKKEMLEQAELWIAIGKKRNKLEYISHGEYMLEVASTL